MDQPATSPSDPSSVLRPPSSPLLTTEDVDRGWKEVPVIRLDGAPATVKLYAPHWRARRELVKRLMEGTASDDLLLEACVGDSAELAAFDARLNQLTPASLGQLESVAAAMVFGEDFAKKLQATMRGVAMSQWMTTGNASAPNSDSSVPATEPTGSPAGVTPS